MARLRFLYAALVGAVLAVPSPRSLRSDITILIDNDLEGPGGSAETFSALYLSRKHSFEEAVASCRALGEELWKPALGAASIDAAVTQITTKGLFEKSPEIWVAPESRAPQALSASGEVVEAEASAELPVLCTQTAPFSDPSFQDTAEEWQTIVSSNNEELVGFRDRLSFRFLGVRYAPEPKRFTYPQLFKGSHGQTSALSYAEQCVQYGSGSEDCLFLNIWTPYLPQKCSSPKRLKPVLFWIHGGALEGGTSSDQLFDGGNMVSRGDVVLVAINYRLSTLGYLALDDGVTNGNYGLADQILALDWVRANIRDFGGDPDRITVFGQSAGAGSARAIMASPKAQGKFSGVILMSNLGGLAYGTTYSKYYTIEEEVEVAAKAILELTGCSDAAVQVDCLREVDAGTLTTLSTRARYLVVDGTYLTTDELPLEGSRQPIELMIGIAAQDGAPFISYPVNVSTGDTTWLTTQGLPDPPQSLYPYEPLANRTLAAYRMGAELATDAMYRCIDQATTYAGLENGVFDKVYYYEFERTYQMAGWPGLDICEAPKSPAHPFGDPAAEIGYLNCHSGELYYAFGNLRRSGLEYRDEDGDEQFQKEVLDRWTAFAWGRGPNVPSKTKWEPSVKGNMQLMVLDWPRESVTGFRHLEQCEWLDLPLDYYM
ncbi:crystal protein [Stachybotrys elegans]|uniref:Carboxylic ester hydrolase n=1 Tax=Stachybotrys elegans TaxID=80388 RepID=A0A8K0SRU2_9HYPO|nr:crystal protein [Stachybotrys elegans]